MEYKSIEEIKTANLADWEKEVMIKEFKFRQNLSEIGKIVFDKERQKLRR